MKKKTCGLNWSKGFANVLVLLILLVGLGAGLFLVNSKESLKLFSRAADPKNSSSAVEIGLVTDTHYSRVHFPNRLAVAQGLISTFNSKGVDLVLGLGDMYDGFYASRDDYFKGKTYSLDDYLQDKAQYEVPYASSKAPVRWVVGNHDINSFSTSDYTNNSKYAVRNWVFDLPDNWRIIAYTNVEDPYNSAKSDTLDWLKNVLSQAKTEGKKIIIATHAHIDLDYPSAPRDIGSQAVLTTRIPGTVLTPSATVGTASVSASLAGTFSSWDVGKPLHLLFGANWGWGIVTSFIDSKTITVNIKSAYGGTGPADSAEIGGFSRSSLNADDQRAIIDEAVANGTQVKYVFSGHAHKNSTSTVNGVTYYGFLNTGDNGAGEIINLTDNSIDIAFLTTDTATLPGYSNSTFFIDGVNGNDNNTGTVRNSAWKTLNKAAQKAKTPGDRVTILPAIYRESVYFTFSGLQNNPITWIYEPDAKQVCVSKEAGQPGSALQIPDKVSYLTIQGGEFAGCRTSGISIQGNHITISGVTSKGNGSGISYTSAGTGNLITKSQFIDNDTAGIGIYQGTPTLTYNIAARNQTGFDMTSVSPSIYNVVSYGNQWGFGIGNNSASPGPVIRNAISQGNTKGGINSYGSGASAVSNSIVADGGKWGNTTKSNISTADPRFVKPAENNFNLLSNSPAIDFGVDVGLTSDFDGNSITGKPDAGVFEYQAPNPTGSAQTTQPANNSSSQSPSGEGGAQAPGCTDAKPAGAPKLLSASVSGKNQVSLVWSKAPDPVTYYLVAYGSKSGKLEYGNPNIGGRETTSYVVKGLENNKTYYFRVRAGNVCAPGDFSNEVAVKAVGDNISSGPAVGFKAGVLGAGPANKQTAPAKSSIFAQPGRVMENLGLFFMKILSYFINIFKK